MLSTRDRSSWRAFRWGAIAAILIAPAIAMQFTAEMAWDAADFALLALLLVGAGLVYEVVAARLPRASHRAIAGAAAVFVVLVGWADAAVGIF
ncbi:hypothetical protein [Glacieibacterium frigidum]|uniref:Heavy metal translocating P-type ATPase n=1 Tax=Glacieibacterium frigidum TaxID=2593303 RepID=A0A552UAH6_9SPHN|nr:hypothetical protein [Glacieibacterium frigidum]TRW15212.1 hypothetical protein FMM06_16415 [Glacieibacterium frigidum]